MKTTCVFSFGKWIALAILVLGSSGLRAVAASAPSHHAASLGESVLRLLESRDADRFADEVALTNSFNRKRVSDSARLVVDQATRLGLVHFRIQEVRAAATGTAPNPQSGTPGDSLPFSFGIRIILSGEVARGSQPDNRLRSEYELALGGALEFPDGWRTLDGIRWSRLPASVTDEKTQREVALSSTIEEHFRASLHAVDDPALAVLGKALIHLLQQGDEKVFAHEALPSFEETWDRLVKQLDAGGVKTPPPREEIEDGWNMGRGAFLESAQSVLAQAEVIGIDFAGSEVALKDVVADNPYMRGTYGSVDGVTAELRFVINVKSDRKSKAARPLAGEYTLTAKLGRRTSTRWTIEDKIRWEKFADGLLGEKEMADLAFENYVAKNGVLPPGTAAPDAEFLRLDGKGKFRLSYLRGKVVVLEWWSTWCGPCQKAMADLQARREHPPAAWGNSYEVIAVSVDDELRQAQDRVSNRGWTNSLNAWAGPGGWMSAPAKQFRLQSIPTCYLIDPEGKVTRAGNPLAANW
jgi:thiol-disulfide isomerase/thioredoxin